MAKKWLRVAAVATTLVMASSVAAGLTGCKKSLYSQKLFGDELGESLPGKPTLSRDLDPNGGVENNNPNTTLGKTVSVEAPAYTYPAGKTTGYRDTKVYSYQDYTSVMPSNWNEMTYQDNNDTQILNFIGSNFFEYDFKYRDDKKFNDDGTVNTAGIIDGEFTVHYAAATKLEDVTADYKGHYGIASDSKDTNRAFKITLRQDLKWSDGTPIKAADFVYSMKEQLNPLFFNYRANLYYGGSITINNAKNYVYQGSEGIFDARTSFGTYSTDIDSKLIFTLGNSDENKAKYDGSYVTFRDGFGVPDTYTAAMLAEVMATNYLTGVTAAQITALEGKTLAEIKADAALKATWDAIIKWWQTEPNEELDFFVGEGSFPAMDFDKVGLFSTGDYEIVMCLDNSLPLLTSDGKLTYWAPYYLGSLPLVKQSVYEANKKAPVGESTLWTSTYNSSFESSASWGPYKLSTFDAGSHYVLERNDNWFGYGDDLLSVYGGQYQTDSINCRKIDSIETAWMNFMQGNLDSIGLDVDHADEYRNSKYTLYSPGSNTFSFHLQADYDTLVASKHNNVILSTDEFRMAISLGVDRASLAAAITTAYQPAYGLLNSQYYYDVENGGVYRNTDAAKEVLLETYGFTKTSDGKWTSGNRTYNTLDEAYKAMTGFNLTRAKQLVEQAYLKIKDDKNFNNKQKITIVYGSSADNEGVRKQYDFVKNTLETLVEGTALEGNLDVKFDASFGSSWSDYFKNGAYELCFSAWGGAEFNPVYLLSAYFDPDNMYTTYWETDKEMLKITLPEQDSMGYTFAGAGRTVTMALTEWYDCLMGASGAPFDWQSGKLDEQVRCYILSKMEALVMEKYYAIPVITQFSAQISGARLVYATKTENTFMGFGSMRYLTYSHDDTEWKAFCASHNNQLGEFYKASDDNV